MENKDLVRIITPASGAAYRTKVFAASGEEIPGVTRIVVDPLDIDSRVVAEITLMVGACDIHAHPLLSLESLREAAAAHGFALVRREG